MRRPHRFTLSILIPAGAGIGFGAAWIAVTGSFRPPVWALITVSLALVVLSYVLVTAGPPRRRRLPARHRAHARPTASRPHAGSANPTNTRKDTTTA
jgi:hypothetical protein